MVDSSRTAIALDRGTFAPLAATTAVATWLLMMVGSLVRVSGAGLGCPDWPKCFGLWIPPRTAASLPEGFDPALFNAVHTWTEYLNRLIGVAVGLLILATTLVAFRQQRHRPVVVWSTFAAFLLVGFEGWLGGQVVHLRLAPWVVTVHLVCALLILGLLLYAAVTVRFPSTQSPARVDAWRAYGVAGLVVVQTVLGALVRGAVDDARIVLGEAARGEWLSTVGGIDIWHRQLSLIVLAGAIWLVVTGRAQGPGVRRSGVLALALVGTQIAVGLTLAYASLPAPAQVLHLGVASALFCALFARGLAAARGA